MPFVILLAFTVALPLQKAIQPAAINFPLLLQCSFKTAAEQSYRHTQMCVLHQNSDLMMNED